MKLPFRTRFRITARESCCVQFFIHANKLCLSRKWDQGSEKYSKYLYAKILQIRFQKKGISNLWIQTKAPTATYSCQQLRSASSDWGRNGRLIKNTTGVSWIEVSAVKPRNGKRTKAALVKKSKIGKNVDQGTWRKWYKHEVSKIWEALPNELRRTRNCFKADIL